MMLRDFFRRLLLLAALNTSIGCAIALSEEVRVAVAANFLETLRALEPEFVHATGHRVSSTAASTGLLYAQILNGAPFDVLLGADQERPRLLADGGYGAASEVFTYAIGRLVLWSADPARVDETSLTRLDDAQFRWLAIASPATAPYGAAARQALESLGVWQSVQSRLVRGQNVAQTFAMIETGNAEWGFVALSQALAYGGAASYVLVPQELHEPIRQDGVLLRHGSDNIAARAFIEFLRSPVAAAIVEQNGYSVPHSRQ